MNGAAASPLDCREIAVTRWGKHTRDSVGPETTRMNSKGQQDRLRKRRNVKEPNREPGNLLSVLRVTRGWFDALTAATHEVDVDRSLAAYRVKKGKTVIQKRQDDRGDD